MCNNIITFKRCVITLLHLKLTYIVKIDVTYNVKIECSVPYFEF